MSGQPKTCRCIPALVDSGHRCLTCAIAALQAEQEAELNAAAQAATSDDEAHGEVHRPGMFEPLRPPTPRTPSTARFGLRDRLESIAIDLTEAANDALQAGESRPVMTPLLQALNLTVVSINRITERSHP